MPEPKIQKKNNAQAALEYLLTYGWALILIATVIGVLVFVVMTPSSQVVFSSSNPTKILMKGSAITGSMAEIRLQNITGGNIDITSAGGCQVNGSSPPVSVSAGGLILVECSAPGGSMQPITIEYTDFAGLQRSVEITASGTAGGSSGPTDYVAYYALNEASGVTASDSSVNGLDGTLMPDEENGPQWQTTPGDCPSGNCLLFDGIDDRVDAGETVTSTPYTICNWFYLTDATDSRTLAIVYSSGSHWGPVTC